MLDGWYCRSINEQAQQAQQQQQHQQSQEPQPHSSSSTSHQPTAAAAAARNNASTNNINISNNSSDGEDLGGGLDGGDSTDQTDPDSDEDVLPARRNIDYKAQYNELKKKLKYLLYENEFFQENLRTSQRRLLKITRDRSFLLDRLLQYEKVDVTSSEDDDTESSDDSSKADPVPTVGRKRKNDPVTLAGVSLSQNKNPPKRRKPGPKKQQHQQLASQHSQMLQQRQFQASLLASQQQHPHQHPLQDGHLTAEEVERHLQSRAQSMSLVPEGELPNEMFSQNPSSESNDPMVDTSPSNIGEECLSADMTMMQQE